MARNHMRIESSRRTIGALLIACCFLPLVCSADEHREFRHGPYQSHEFREHEFRNRGFLDARFNHGHYYPFLGYRFGRLPYGYHRAFFGGVPYFFSAGVWYALYGAAYVVVAPPYGITVPVLPPYYTTVWIGGTPYYYANRVYYAQSPQGYVVVPEPTGQIMTSPPPNAGVAPGPGVIEHGPVSAPPPPQAQVPPQPSGGNVGTTAQLFIYPRQGQSADQQAKDRGECHSWAVSQTGVDPTIQRSGPSSDRLSDYARAIDACLDARGYTVR
jgi:hypothetical protein